MGKNKTQEKSGNDRKCYVFDCFLVDGKSRVSIGGYGPGGVVDCGFGGCGFYLFSGFYSFVLASFGL